MEKFKCIIIDDEPQAIEMLSDHLALLYKNVEVIATCATWTNAIETLRSQEADIVFLDISLQNKNGMELLRLMPDLHAEVVFVTAYSDYALDAYKLTASGYILKPIDETELVKTVDKALKRIKDRRNANKNINTEHVVNKIGIPNNKAIDYVNALDIIYLSAEGSYTRVVTIARDLVSSYNIQKFKSVLDMYPFYQIHRSYIVNVNRILRYENSGIVIMENNIQLPVSKIFREQFLKLFNVVNQGAKNG